MAQLLLKVQGVQSKENADKLKVAGEALDTVLIVNVNHDDGRVVITHKSDNFDVEVFKKVAEQLGFPVAS